MENIDNKILDANGNEVTLCAEDFNFIQQDKKIKDKNFDTKPTTFFKDALNRFRKSKSSVVAAIIIGILILLSLIVPVASPYNDYSGNINIAKMTPRLFSNGTFWAGKRTYSDQPYDLNTNSYGSSFNESYIYNSTFAYGKSNTSSSSNVGGLMLIVAQSSTRDVTFSFKQGVTIPANSDLVLNLEITNDENVLASKDAVFSSYQIDLYKLDESSKSSYVTALQSVSTKTGEYSINIGDILKNNSIGEVENAIIQITVKAGSTKTACLPIQAMSFTTSDTTLSDKLSIYTLTKDSKALETTSLSSDDSQKDEVETYLNALKNHGAIKQVTNADLYKVGSGSVGVYGANCATTTFKYDEYQSKLGLQSYTITQSKLKEYVDNGWCEFNFTTKDKSSFKLLSDKCPIKDISSVNSVGSSFEVTGNVLMYQYYGYNSMPRFLFGTDGQGRDLFTYAFYALRTSLIIAFIVTAINFTVGIIYGSVEGYFGGNVDLFMERISDILGYLPTTILITLLFLNYGKSLFIFGLGMTLTGWLGVASRTRTQFYRFKGREYVLASRTLGASDARLIFKHVLPNSLGTIITTSVLMVPGTISTEATLSYIGLGLEGTASFGVVMSDNQQELLSNPNLVLFPAVIMSLLMISFNLFGNGLRDAFNPSLKGSE